MDELNRQRQKLVNQLQETRIEEAQPNAVIVVKLRSEKAQSIPVSLSYVVAQASWEAYYDMRVTSVAEPLRIEYKAKVNQNTGEDWKGVQLTLSTGNPYTDGRLPELNPWYINYTANRYSRSVTNQAHQTQTGVTGKVNGVVIDNVTAESIAFANIVATDDEGRMVAGTYQRQRRPFQTGVEKPGQPHQCQLFADIRSKSRS
ncbi:MAG: DUF4139 domain-containing protein [Owenweeksia sp.]|nr:DUF4139 domain-containing protein [Owenweeksia sp.]